MKIAVCDDNEEELSRISSVLDIYKKERIIDVSYQAFHSPIELLSIAKGVSFDLYLLDVIMPVLNGIEVAREVRSYDKVSHIIFLTASPEFAVDSYSVKADNYFLKPICKEKLFFTLDEIVESRAIKKQPMITIKGQDCIESILLSQLTHVEAFGRTTTCYLSSGKTVKSSSGFSQICQQLLDYKEFVQIHRSYVVNMHHITTIKSTEIIMQTGVAVPIAGRRLTEIRERFLAFQMEV